MNALEIHIAHGWKALALRGLASMLFGVVAFLWPSFTLMGLVVLFGVYAVVDGALALTLATRQSVRRHAWVFAAEGLIGVGAGVATLCWPQMTVLALVYFIGAWGLLTGALEVMLAVRLRHELSGEFLLGLGGAASMLLGALLLFWPAPGSSRW
jgi:uncharacterized membrane protein HdeD (DUF308 family)